MSQLPNGNDIYLRSFVFEVSDHSKVGEARRFAAELASEMSFTETRSGQLAILVNELATNLYRHASAGSLVLRPVHNSGVTYVEVLSFDRGPGITDLSDAFQDGYTTGATPGTGLGAVRRMSDLFDAESSERGTLIVCELHASNESAALMKNVTLRVSGICMPISGESVSGDAWAMRETANGLQIVLADGLGHGPEAHIAAVSCMESFRAQDSPSSVDILLSKFHLALKATRGAAVSVADITYSTSKDSLNRTGHVSFAGAGNVRALVCENGKDRTLLTHAGTVGLKFKPRPAVKLDFNENGRFIIHSDGIQSRWTSDVYRTESRLHPGLLAAAIFRDNLRGTDDATVVVAGHFDRTNQ